ncbi:DUF3575 domain-containing protein [Tellurirhabdus rosea]|uniref:DUF3575 domain-containing protein n=1 Tax=Tellurirhabdus rosea TaxID=2674997 RepID=UPI002255EE6E|nr:DUF3575 domain-containing protein [Tellurirhabdus rosea]
MKKLFLLLAVLLGGQMAHAQDTLTLKQFEKESFAVLKWSPLTLLNPDPSLQVGAEFRTSARESVQAEVGYGRFASWGTDNEEYRFKETWRARAEYRWYLRPYRKRQRPGQLGAFPFGTYLAAELFYKQINVLDRGTVGRDCADGGFNCAYFEDTYQPVSRFVKAGYFKIGWQMPFSTRPLSRFLMDFNVGIGFRHVKVRRYGAEADFFGGAWFDRFDYPDTPLVPDLTVGFKVGYLLQRNN